MVGLTQEQKISLLHEVEAHARSVDKRVSQVIVSLSGVYEKVLVAATDGTYATDIRPLVRLNCSVLVEENGKRERGSSGVVVHVLTTVTFLNLIMAKQDICTTPKKLFVKH